MADLLRIFAFIVSIVGVSFGAIFVIINLFFEPTEVATREGFMYMQIKSCIHLSFFMLILAWLVGI